MRGYRYEALDGVRGMAAQAVLLSHAVEMVFLPAHGPAAAAMEWVGRVSVMVFFSLSGFVIATSLSRLTASDRSGFAVPYAVHRLARIWPPLVLAVVITFAVGALGRAGLPLLTRTGAPYALDGFAFLRGITLTFAPTDATFVIDNPLWSLRQEVYLYGVAGFSALALVGRGPWRLVGAMVTLGLVAATADRFFYLQSLSLFAAGACAALAGGDRRLRAVATSPFLGPVVLALVLAPLAFTGRPGFIDAMSADAGFLAVQAALGIPVGLGLLGLAVGEGRAARGFARCAGAAAFSYTLYVIHMPILVLAVSLDAHRGLGGPAPTFVLAILVAEAAAIVLARLVERPRAVRALMFRLLGKAGLHGTTRAA